MLPFLLPRKETKMADMKKKAKLPIEEKIARREDNEEQILIAKKVEEYRGLPSYWSGEKQPIRTHL